MTTRANPDPETIVRSSVAVETALLDDRLVPAAPPATLHAGATAQLRGTMARFSSGDEHQHRRLAVERVIRSIERFPFAAEAARRTDAALSAGAADAIADIAFVVPVETVASALGVANNEVTAVRHEVRNVVAVIGRGQESGPDSDDAVARLHETFGGPSNDSTERISLLYQTHDATAALFATMLAAHVAGMPRRSALTSTVRRVLEPLELAGTALEANAIVTIDLESAGFEFGAGAHGCPGRSIAERIVAGMTEAFHAGGFRIDHDGILLGADGRPTAIPLLPEQGSAPTGAVCQAGEITSPGADRS